MNPSTYFPLALGDLDRPLPSARPDRPGRPSDPARQGAAATAEALAELLDEAALLIRRLRERAEAKEVRDRLSRGRRDLLCELARSRPRTVPQLARARAVSRQHIQAQVNALAEAGYLEFFRNPAHRRSPLIRLTDMGRRLVGTLERRGAGVLSGLAVEVCAEEFRQAVGTLQAVRAALEGDAPQ
ncbi:MAG: MarR family transcriptional regulator [Gemmatimonadota bacterium]|nr:MAG: MarR family transcriptional regulator [Gemmatimonadota bacterium]